MIKMMVVIGGLLRFSCERVGPLGSVQGIGTVAPLANHFLHHHRRHHHHNNDQCKICRICKIRKMCNIYNLWKICRICTKFQNWTCYSNPAKPNLLNQTKIANQITQTKSSKPNQTFLTKPTKPNLPNQTYQTKFTEPNLPNQTYQTKPTIPNRPNLLNQTKFVQLSLPNQTKTAG